MAASARKTLLLKTRAIIDPIAGRPGTSDDASTTVFQPSSLCTTTLAYSQQFIENTLFVRAPDLSTRFVLCCELSELFLKRSLPNVQHKDRDDSLRLLTSAKYAVYWLLRIQKLMRISLEHLKNNDAIKSLRVHLQSTVTANDKTPTIVEETARELTPKCSLDSLNDAKKKLYESANEDITSAIEAYAMILVTIPYLLWKDGADGTIDMRLLFAMLTENRMLLHSNESFIVVHEHWYVHAALCTFDGLAPQAPLKRVTGVETRAPLIPISLATALGLVGILHNTAFEETARLA